MANVVSSTAYRLPAAVTPGLSVLLNVEHLTTRFDALVAVDDVSFTIQPGTITGLIGPNGAGKSTLFNTIAGEIKAAAGCVTFNKQRIDRLSPDAIFRRGLVRTFQVPRPFPEMNVLENLMLAAPGQAGESCWAPILRPAKVRQQEAELADRAHELLQFMTLDSHAQSAAGQLSGGQHKLLELARVLMSEPAMIMLDEPAAGINPTLTELLIDRIHTLNERGMTFLIIEHNMEFIMRHCDPIIAMANGRIIFEGSSSAAMASSVLIDSYLGEAEND